MRTHIAQLRAIIVAVACLVAVVAGPGTASAALQVSGVTLDGATSVSTPPGGVLTAKVTTKTTSPTSTWRSTRQRLDSALTCVNTGNQSGTGTHSVSYDLTAPGVPGAYDAGFTAASGESCAGTQSPETVLEEGIRVTTPAPNPNLAERCGINVMLVLDKSGSIASSGATDTVRAAARGFLQALSGTGSTVSIVDFSTTAAQPVPYTSVTENSIATVFDPYLKNGYKPSGWTNWEAAFQQVERANAVPGGTKADLVLFITDGDPTAYNRVGSSPVTGLTPGDAMALRRAAAAADIVKGQGSHVFALGVGEAVTSQNSARRLTAISGFQRYPEIEPDFGKGDYGLVEDFADLPAALRALAVALCKGSVAVTKVVDEGDGIYRPDPGWAITAAVDTTPGSYTWTQPPPPAPGPRTAVTGADGVANFQWKPDRPAATTVVTLQEAVNPGYTLVDWICTTSSLGRATLRSRQGTSLPITTGVLLPGDYAKCTLRNRILPGTIEIEKVASPQGPQAFSFTGSAPLGAFSLIDDGAAGPSSKTFTGLVPGTYTVAENVPADWELARVTCSDPGVVIAGAQVTIALAAGKSVVCTYADHQVDPIGPPVPPVVPPVTPGGGPTPPPAPPVVIASTQLSVHKTTPRRARVGGRVPFSLRVTNTGTVAATNVTLLDVPPAAMTLTELRSSGALGVRIIRGDAVWKLGTLAPGASRTVRGSVVITGATPGIARNTAIVAAANAPLGVHQVDTRVLPARVITPPVTG